MGLLTIVIVTVIITVVGGGLGWFLFMRAKPKKIAWTAHCYQLSEGVRDAKIDKRSGKPLSDLKLQDLRPYTKDILVRVEKEHARTVHKLERLNMTTNAVNADMVDVWSSDEKVVDVLIVGDTATIIKKGYDKVTGNIIFQPMSRERMDLIKSEILIKKDRFRKEKDILQAITPWIVTGICILGLVSIAYFVSNSHLKASEKLAEAEKFSATKQLEAAVTYREGISTLAREVERANAVIEKVEPSPPVLEPEIPVMDNGGLGIQ